VTGSDLALDTNQAVAVLNSTDGDPEWLAGVETLYLPVTVVGELRFGALKSGRVAANLRRVDDLVTRCHVLQTSLATAEVYARVRHTLKVKGRPIPENDIWIAAHAIEHGLPLATADAHFLEIDGLTVIRR
jgi:tRNA(fMet)-specific endonuclease VapC